MKRIAILLAVFATLVACLPAITQAANISPGGNGTLGTVNYVSGNIALAGTATQTSTRVGSGANVASAAIDGDTNGSFFSGGPMGTGSTTHTAVAGPGQSWNVDLGGEFAISNVVIFNRSDCCSARLTEFNINVLNSATGVDVLTPFDLGTPGNGNTGGVPKTGGTQTNPPAGLNHMLANNTVGTDVQVVQNAAFVLSLAEVQAFGDPSLELAGDTLQIDISDIGGDMVNVEGDATLDGTLEIFDSGSKAFSVIDILTAANIDAQNLTLAGDLDNISGFRIVAGGNGQILQLVTAPEPGSIAVWGLMAICVAWLVRRRRVSR